MTASSLPERRRLAGISIPFAAVVGSMVLGLLLIAASGKSVPDAIEAFLDGAFGTAFAFGASVNRAVALSLVGLGFILAFRANLTNVGGEGQIAVGGIAAAGLAVRLRAIGLNELAARRAGMPGGVLLVSALAIAGAFGGLAGAIMLQGEQYYLKIGFSSGHGFDGLVVGLLSRGSTVGVLAGALFFGFL